jgi:hypothetical protein
VSDSEISLPCYCDVLFVKCKDVKLLFHFVLKDVTGNTNLKKRKEKRKEKRKKRKVEKGEKKERGSKSGKGKKKKKKRKIERKIKPL